MSCEKQCGRFYNLSLIDGSIEEVHFKPVEKKLTSVLKMPNIRPDLMEDDVKRSFAPFLTDVNMTGL